MARFYKQCFFLSIIFWWQITCLASVCSDYCNCDLNTNVCQQCSYDITFKETINACHRLSVCCNDENKLVTWFQEYGNRTLMEVSTLYNNTCNASAFNFSFPLLDTYSLHIRNTSFTEISINIKIQNLRRIDLSSNRLQYITGRLLSKFVNIRQLILSKNNIVSILEHSFNGLSKLETLDLSENNLTILANVFTPLKNLQYLNLSRNSIEILNENYFNNWLLQHLDLSHNNLRKLAPGALQLLPNLARLLLTDNPHLGITQLDTQLLVGTGRRLQQIDASRTGLYQVPEAFTHSVRFLTLVGNKISAIRCGDFDSYPLLQSLDFAENKVTSVEDDSLGRLEMLLFLNMNKNVLMAVPKTLPDELKYLSINNNLIKNLSVPDFKNLPNLRILMLQNNEIRYIQDHVFDDLLSLEMLDLSNNPIQTLSWSTFDGPLSLRDLRLCYLNISVPERDGSFPISSPESVQMLHLQSSPGLARQLLADSAALAAFSRLQYLDLRMNNLSEIRNDLLFYLAQLKTLRLHGNKINCSAELWLKDWINWNKNSSNSESCYYSTSEAKSEITKYNCTFPETFTISDSLPPVNLYSTEMINKLLRYYGYLNNKTEKIISKHWNKSKDDIIHNFSALPWNKASRKLKTNNSISAGLINIKESLKRNERNENRLVNYYTNETTIEIKESSKMSNQNKMLEDRLIDHKFLDIDVNNVATTRSYRNGAKTTGEFKQNKSRSGKRLNTPLNVTKPVESIVLESELANFTSKISNEAENMSRDGKEYADGGYKTEYSHYKASHNNYAQYIGTMVVCSLVLISFILWISFRLRYKRRNLAMVDSEAEIQIEVSNISGGVLW